MIQRNHAGDKPRIASTACVHPSAVVIGYVEIGERVLSGQMP
jgi:carbonic anhydrase/acetyltransferase-like protein (isoleucine patch superfamily)